MLKVRSQKVTIGSLNSPNVGFIKNSTPYDSLEITQTQEKPKGSINNDNNNSLLS